MAPPLSRRHLLALLLLAATVAIYLPALGNGFVWDDLQYVTRNPALRAGLSATGMRWAWTTFHGANWHPLTWISHLVDLRLFGLDARGHHLVNLLLHAANMLLLFLLVLRATGSLRPAVIVAGLFGLHPVHVESVAWIAERKDLLCTLFWFLALLAYFSRSGSRRWVLLILAFGLGLLAKPMIVTLPLVLLILDFWPRGRFTPMEKLANGGAAVRALFEKTPLLALSAASGIMTILAQSAHGALLVSHSLGERLVNAVVSYAAYAVRSFVPLPQAVYYPFPTAGHPWWKIAFAALFLAAVTWVAVRQRAQRPYLLAGWLWFGITLLPVIGIVQVGGQSMADRYVYVPSIGLSLMAAFLIEELTHRRLPRLLWAPLILMAFALLGISTWRELAFWRNDETLFTRAIVVTGDNALAQYNLGVALQDAGRNDLAESRFREALRLDPGYAEAHNNLGFALSSRGRYEEALDHYRTALEIDPHFPEAHNNYGLLLSARGSSREAVQHYRLALEGDPDSPQAHHNLGLELAKQGAANEALHHLVRAVELNPDYAEARFNLGLLLLNLHRPREAMLQFREATRIRPDWPDAQNNLGSALAQLGDAAGAEARFLEALRLSPDDPMARDNLKRLLAGKTAKP